jgi:phage N-6-adenine-methyltransferase
MTERPVETAQRSSGAHHRFNNDLRYREDDHEMQRQLTPGYVLEPVRQALGGIALDPCTEPDNPTGATRFYTAATDGAEEAWDAETVYVNPPYSKARERWVARCIEAAAAGTRVVLLMPSHTDTRLFHRAVETASHVVFIKGRVKFGVLRENGRQEAASHPSCLIAWNLTSAGPMAALGRVWDLTTPPGERSDP